MMRLQSIVQSRHPEDPAPREIEAVPLVRTDKKSVRKIHKCLDRGEFPTSLLRFGPVYYVDGLWESAKEEAWKQMLKKPLGEDEENMSTNKGIMDKDVERMDVYLCAIRRVERKARAAYTGEILDRFTESQFRWLLIKDGCFFLQLALFILGASKELGYPDSHKIFGKNQEKKVVYGWIKSMFYVGNQIPLVVLNEFMKESFFQKVIKDHGKWDRPTDLSSKGVLYDLLIQPAMPDAESQLSQEQPSDLLYALQNLVLGQKVLRDDSDDDEEDDEEDEEEGHDLEAGPKLDTVEVMVDNDGKDCSVSSFRIKGIYLERSNGAEINGSQLDNFDSKERCITGLRRKGIHFWKSNGVGISGIRFKNRMFYPGLYLPTITLNRDTDMLLENLKYYEECQQQNEVRSYLALMNQLISTYEDVNHLASNGIFEASKPQYKEKFLRILKKLRLPETATNHDHRYVLQQLRDYSSFPWEYFKYVAIIAFVLSVLQTIFGVLGYVVGLKQLHGSKS